MEVSFCIITGGKRPELIRVVFASILAQRVPVFEIIVVGIFKPEKGLVYVEANDAAERGRLGEMRNRAIASAMYENIVIMDDDIVLSHGWYANFVSYGGYFDILTSQIRTPDGSRYCDHVTILPSKHHRILAEDEDDDYVYMTGGGGWVMKDYVAKLVKWDEKRVINESEDVDFSRRCQKQGFKILHNHKMLVFHADSSYTCIGRTAFRRIDGRSHEWIKQVVHEITLFNILNKFIYFWKIGQIAEAGDCLRTGLIKFPSSLILKFIWEIVINKFGGNLPKTYWFDDGDPEYLYTLDIYHDYTKRIITRDC